MPIDVGSILIDSYPIEVLKELSVKQAINEHATLKLQATLKSDIKDKPIYEAKENQLVTVQSRKEGTEGEIIFTGIVEFVQIRQFHSVYEIELIAKSSTILLDRQYRSRSFQNKAMKYIDVVKFCLKNYGKTDVICTAGQTKKTEQFILQYEETDWAFFKRLASHHHVGLVPEIQQAGIKFTFGLPKGGKKVLEETKYVLKKNLTDFMKFKLNEDDTIMDLDSFIYEIDTDECFRIGDEVTFQGHTFVVSSIETFLYQANIVNRIQLRTKKGCYQPKQYHEKIIGLSIQGTVIEVKKDEVKLHLCIDPDQPVKIAHPLKYATPYTAEGQSGWYFMPELGDTVLAYFPTRDEKDVFALHSLRTKNSGSDKTTDPDIKYLRTKYGKEIKFAKDEIVITCVDHEMYIKLNETSGIEIFSTKPIQVNSHENISIQSDKKINITAKDEIKLNAKMSLIQLSDDVLIQGKEVKHN